MLASKDYINMRLFSFQRYNVMIRCQLKMASLRYQTSKDDMYLDPWLPTIAIQDTYYGEMRLGFVQKMENGLVNII